MNLGQELWNLTIATQCLDELDAEDLMACYQQAFVLNNEVRREKVSETERRWASRLLDDIQKEVAARGINVLSLFVQMNENGEFLHGRDELKKFWFMLEFDSMVEIADEMMAHCINDKQRNAIIELQREVVLMSN